MRQVRFDTAARLNEVYGIVIMLFDTCRNGENIRVKNNVFGWEIYLLGQ